MHLQTSAALILGAAIVIAALLFVLSPLLWTDHLLTTTSDARKPMPASCSVTQALTTTSYGIVHCPVWVQY